MRLLKILPMILLLGLSTANARTINIKIENATDKSLPLTNDYGYWDGLPAKLDAKSSYEFTSPDLDDPNYDAAYPDGYMINYSVFSITLKADGDGLPYESGGYCDSYCDPTYKDYVLVALDCKILSLGD